MDRERILNSHCRSRGAILRLLAFVAIAVLPPVADAPAMAQGAQPDQMATPPPEAEQLLDLLGSPAVRDWLAQRATATAGRPGPMSVNEAQAMPASFVTTRIAVIRQHLADLNAAAPRLPDELQRVGGTMLREVDSFGLVKVLLLIAGFVVLGFGSEQVYYRLLAGIESWIVALPVDTVRDRLRAIAVRLAYGTGMVAAFATGSIGAFLVFDWPPLLRELVLGYLVAFVALRLALVASRFFLAPGGERFRILPMPTPAAWYWHRRIGLLVGWFVFGYVTVRLLDGLGMLPDARRLVAYMLGLVLLALGLEAVWRRPRSAEQAEEPDVARDRHWKAVTWLASGYFIVLWLLWVLSAIPAFWLALVAVGLPVTISATQRAADHVLRPPGEVRPEAAPGMVAVSLARGLRALWIVGAAWLLAWAWQIDLVAMTERDTLGTRLLRGGLNAVVIILAADFVWHVAKALIDQKISGAGGGGSSDNEEARRGARLRTLLPILRNALLVVLVVVSVLMALAALGVEIGPLIAGAGVVGVAIGFGAQTLVKDIISGMFYLLDDAFRVGEYIQSGSYKGTVESFSLRSVKLRHHRGPLYTVPFGELGAIQNMSRDWVIDKLTVSVTYDTDLDKVKKLVREIGKELQRDPELAPHIIETLKMQGVEQFGDFAIDIRMKMMTKPGEQFVIRRRAYALIKKAFDANGIKFAYPTVQVAGGESTTAAAAQQALGLTPPPTAAT